MTKTPEAQIDLGEAIVEYVMDYADALNQVGDHVRKLLGLEPDADVTENREFWEVFTLQVQQSMVSAANRLVIRPGDLILH